MKYLVIYKQEEQGCDYTIGCGTRCEIIDAADDAALEQAIGRALFSEDGMEHSEQHIVSARYVPLESVRSVDLMRLRKHYADQRDVKRKAETEAAERAQLQRLQAKYGRTR